MCCWSGTRPARPRTGDHLEAHRIRPAAAKPEVKISVDDPRAADVRRLVDRHLEFARSNHPAADVGALDVTGLLDDAITFFSCRVGEDLLAIGALKRLDGATPS